MTSNHEALEKEINEPPLRCRLGFHRWRPSKRFVKIVYRALDNGEVVPIQKMLRECEICGARK